LISSPQTPTDGMSRRPASALFNNPLPRRRGTAILR
jgi:hypothetical protein